MTNPWGLSGPEFLWLYIGGFVVAGIATLLLRNRIRSTSTQRAEEPLTVDEIAFLTGGWMRVVESALANLVERNVVRVQRNGLLYPVSDSNAKPESTIEERLVNRITARTGRPLPYHLASMANLPEYTALEISLADKGLYSYGSNRRQVFAAASPLIVLFAIGVARWINGVNLGFPVGYLTGLLILTVIVTLFALREVKAGPTKAGKQALSAVSPGDAAEAVARRGMHAYPDLTISRLFRESRMKVRSRGDGSAYTVSSVSTFGAWGASCSSGGSGGGGSSCSGGGGGGGGCGGGGGS